MTQQASPIISQLPRSQDVKAQIIAFKKVLKNAGVTLSFNEEPNVLNQEQALIVRDLENEFNSSDDTLREFVSGLKMFCKKERYFKKALQPSVLRKNNGDESITDKRQEFEQESLIKMFLKTNQIQSCMVEILLNELTSVASESIYDTQYLRMLLSPMRYLPYIIDPQQLTTRLLDIIEIATFPSQLEIIDSIPEIVPDSQYAQTAEQLCKLMDDNDELTGASIDCLNALDLDSEIKAQVRDTILVKISGVSNLKVFPILLSFLMSDCKSQNLVPTLLKVRNALDTMMVSSSNSKDQESCKIVIFNKLHMYAVSPKIVSELWLNMIAGIRSHSDHKPIDYLLLFMLHSKAHLKKRIIELMFRKRVQMGLFKINQLEKMLDRYVPQQLMKDYFQSMIEIGSFLLRSANEQIVVEFASTLFKNLFCHPLIEQIYRRDILESLVVLTCSVDQKKIINVLKLISSLLDYKDRVKPHAVLLMSLLEKLDSFNLRDLKEVFEILCSLTCGEGTDDSLSGLKDEIHMIVRKQLHSTKKSMKLKGVISAVVMTRHIALISQEPDEEVPTGMLNINQLPRGPAREAASILQLTSTAISDCTELIGLYYDQLAAMLMPNTFFDPYFLAWLHDTITVNFQDKYLITNSPDVVNDIQSSIQYAINRADEMHDAVRVNIAGLTLTNKSSILLLAPHFRLLRLLNYRQLNGDLSSIDALLGAPVVLPNVDDYDDLDSDQVKQVADCLFHCSNWFRELISGFVTQKKKSIRVKVVRRLEDLLELEGKLTKCLERLPEHKLPASYFSSVTELNRTASPTKKENSKLKNPKKKLKSHGTANENDTMAAATQATTQGPSKKKKMNTRSFDLDNEVKFREMDTDILLLLKYPLKFPENESTQFTETTTLNIDQLKFILKDFVSKVSVLTTGKEIGLSNLNMVVPVHIMTDGAVMLPSLNTSLKMIVKKIAKTLEDVDGQTDSPELFTKDFLKLKACFGLIMEILYLMFSWAGFQHSSNFELLKKLLISLRNTDSYTPLSANRMITEFIISFSSYADQCLEISHAVHLIKTMQALYSLTTPNTEVQKKIVAAAGKLLSKRWYNSKGFPDSGKNYNISVDSLIKVYLSCANIKVICGLVGTLQEESNSLKARDDYLPMMPSVDKGCFHIFYNALCGALFKRVKEEIEALTNDEHLKLWNMTGLAMQGLLTIAKAYNTKTVLGCFLKKSIEILKVFLSHGIPILELTLRSKPEEVVTIFKNIQVSTRFLHHLCCHSKVMKDSSIVAFVPKFRLTLEALIYRVKAILVANNCSAAFWMGNLRNKDLQGEEILSQSTVTDDGNVREDSEEELPDDDDCDETDIDGNENNAEDRSEGSDAFD